MSAAHPSCKEPSFGALDDQLTLELGERGKDAEDQLARRRGRVDRRPLTSQDSQARAVGRELSSSTVSA